MWGWGGVKGLHGQALLYATLRKPLWVLGPHFKCLFILALITRSNPTADTVVCVRKGLECNAEVPLRKPVSLTKHYFVACPVGLSEPPMIVLQPVLLEPQWMHNTRSWFMQALLFDVVVKRDYNYVYQSFLLLLIVAGCYNQISVIRHNGRHSCLRGYRRLLGEKNCLTN